MRTTRQDVITDLSAHPATNPNIPLTDTLRQELRDIIQAELRHLLRPEPVIPDPVAIATPEPDNGWDGPVTLVTDEAPVPAEETPIADTTEVTQTQEYRIHLEFDRTLEEGDTLLQNDYVQKALNYIVGLGLECVDFTAPPDFTEEQTEVRTAFMLLKSLGFRQVRIEGIDPVFLRTGVEFEAVPAEAADALMETLAESIGYAPTEAAVSTLSRLDVLTQDLAVLEWRTPPWERLQEWITRCVEYYQEVPTSVCGDRDYMMLDELLINAQTLQAEYAALTTRAEALSMQIDEMLPLM